MAIPHQMCKNSGVKQIYKIPTDGRKPRRPKSERIPKPHHNKHGLTQKGRRQNCKNILRNGRVAHYDKPRNVNKDPNLLRHCENKPVDQALKICDGGVTGDVDAMWGDDETHISFAMKRAMVFWEYRHSKNYCYGKNVPSGVDIYSRRFEQLDSNYINQTNLFPYLNDPRQFFLDVFGTDVKTAVERADLRGDDTTFMIWDIYYLGVGIRLPTTRARICEHRAFIKAWDSFDPHNAPKGNGKYVDFEGTPLDSGDEVRVKGTDVVFTIDYIHGVHNGYCCFQTDEMYPDNSTEYDLLGHHVIKVVPQHQEVYSGPEQEG